MREEHIVVARHELVIARPDDPESLIDESRFEVDEFLPYWAELWPSGIALAKHVAEFELDGQRVLELGCGLALPSFAAALAGAEVVATDWASEAVDLVALNAAANGLSVTTAVLSWGSDRAPDVGRFDLVVAADVLYEHRNAMLLLDLLDQTVAPNGEALVADPGRRHAAQFFESVRAAGWSVELIAVDMLPGGGITRLRRAEPQETG
jgi:predicted nicotinamide N-methyase